MSELWEQLRGLLPGIWRYRWFGLAVALAVGLAGVAGVLLIPKRYEASARVYVDTQSILKPLMAGLAVEPNLDQQIQMMARTLISRPNIDRMLRMSDLDLKARSPAERDQMIDELTRAIQFKPSGGNNLYSIAYRDESPETARKVVQSLLSIFFESNLGDKRRDSDQARRFIDEQIATYEKKLLDAESALKEFKIRNLSVMPNLANDYVTTAGAAQKDLESSRLELRQLENSREALRRQLADEQPSFTSTDAGPPGIPRPPSETELRLEGARKRLDEMTMRYTDQHPDVINGRRMVKDLEVQLDAERRAPAPAARPGTTTVIPNKIYQDLKVQVAGIDAKIAALRATVSNAESRLGDARKAAQTIPKIEAEYTQLTRDYEVNKKNYDALIARREAAAISGNMDAKSGVGEFRVIDPPHVAPNPVSPNRPLLLAAVLVLSLAAGLGGAFVRDQIQPTFSSAAALRSHTGLPMLGSVGLFTDARAVEAERRSFVVFSAGSAIYVLMFAALIVLSLFIPIGR